MYSYLELFSSTHTLRGLSVCKSFLMGHADITAINRLLSLTLALLLLAPQMIYLLHKSLFLSLNKTEANKRNRGSAPLGTNSNPRTSETSVSLNLPVDLLLNQVNGQHRQYLKVTVALTTQNQMFFIQKMSFYQGMKTCHC